MACFADSKLRKVMLDGSVAHLAEVNEPRGAPWSHDGALVYSREVIGPVYRLSAGGTLACVTGSIHGGLKRLVWLDRSGAEQPIDLLRP